MPKMFPRFRRNKADDNDHDTTLDRIRNLDRSSPVSQDIETEEKPLPISHSSAARSALSTYSLSRKGNLKSDSVAKLREKSRDRRLDPLGLTVLHEPDCDAVADIVFVHGLGGTSKQTWCKDRDPTLFWPLEWLPYERVISSTRISTFGYNAHFMSTSDSGSILNVSHFAKDLLFQLRFAKGAAEKPLAIGTVPVIFVAHSMGGLVVKKAIILGQHDTHYREIVRSTSAVLFLSTPHRGTNLADILNKILSACLFTVSPKDYVADLKTNSHTIQEINEQFRNIAPEMKVVSFYETKATRVGPSHILILQPDSSALGYPAEISEPLDADHHDVCKFESRQHTNYVKVRDILTYLVEEATPKQMLRWLPSNEEEIGVVGQLLGTPEASADDFEFFSEKRLEGSCEWLLEHPTVSQWAETTSLHPHVLWCTGQPGSGKSVAASYLIATLQEQSVSCAYYFFRFGDQEKNSLSQFLLSIAWQVAALIPEYRRRLCKMAEDGLNVQQTAPKLLWQKLFKSSLLRTNLDQPLFIIVDGLDESDVAGSLLRLFLEFADVTMPIRLMLVSRLTQVLSTGIERISKKLNVAHVSLDQNDHDLRLYVSDEMQSMHASDAFRDEITNRILEKATGNFLWVHLVVNEILQCHTEDEVHRALHQVPQDLEPVYERMDAALAAANVKAADQKLGRLVLTWACCSRYPLTVTELEGALRDEYPRLLDLRYTMQQVCGEFIIIDKKLHLTMMHSSAKDFLITNESLNYHVHLHDGHHHALTSCLNMMLPWTPKTKLESFSVPSFALYAATSWAFHLTSSVGWKDQKSLSLLTRFFGGQCVLVWIALLASAGKLRTLVEAAKSLTVFLKITDNLDNDRSPLTHRLRDKELLTGWTHDLIRLVAKFGGQLTKHPKTIYKLVPAFCPHQSAIRTQFSKADQLGAIAIRGQLNPSWDDCLAKFSIASETLPLKIMTLERHFAITTADGINRLYYSSTCEEARSFAHGERVLVTCFNPAGDKMATYGFLRTKLWDTRTARVLCVVENPRMTKAMTMTFSNEDQRLLTLSDDRVIRFCTLDAPQFGWESFDEPVGLGPTSTTQAQINSPKNAEFNQDATLLAVSYRGHHLSVWAVEEAALVYLKRCERQVHRRSSAASVQTSATDAQAFCWNHLTGHIVGIFNDGCVFKWHPLEDDYEMSTIRATNITCSSDGRFFVTGSGNGILRIWDFYHFTPIYQLSYAASLTDIAIDRNETRIYDIRERFCNVWEPNALYRLLDADEKASDAQSTQESSAQVSLLSEASVEDAEPISCLVAAPSALEYYAVGDDGGRLSVFDFDGSLVVDLSERFMTIEKVCWSADSSRIASADLSRNILVEQFDGDSARNAKHTSTVFVSGESESIQQLILSSDGKLLFVALERCLKLYSTEGNQLLSTIPSHGQIYWVIHPVEPTVLLGFGAESVVVTPWQATLSPRYTPITTLHEAQDSAPSINFRRRPSTSYPMSPTEVTTTIEKVVLSKTHSLALVEVAQVTFQGKRDIDWMLLDIADIERADQVASISALFMPATLLNMLEVPLGFILADEHLAPTQNHKQEMPRSPVANHATHQQLRKEGAARHGDFLVFMSKDHWICTFDLAGIAKATANSAKHGPVKKYFFLPRDWVNVELVKLATVTAAGQILCPRNSDVAVIERGLIEPWTE